MEEKGHSFRGKDLCEEAPPPPMAFASLAREQMVELCLLNPRTVGLVGLADTLDDIASTERSVRQKFPGDDPRRVEVLGRVADQRRDVLASGRDRVLADPRLFHECTVALLREGVIAVGEHHPISEQALSRYSGSFGFMLGNALLGTGVSWEDNIRGREASMRFRDRVKVPNLDAAGINRVDPEDLTVLGAYRPRTTSAEPMVGAYAVCQVRGGNLYVKATPAFFEAVEAGEFSNRPQDEAFLEVLQDHLHSGMEPVTPMEVGALTDGLLLATGVMRSSDGDLRGYPGARIFWHERYAVEDPMEVLRSGSEVRLDGVEFPAFTTEWYTTFKTPGETPLDAPYSDCFFVLQGGELALQSYDEWGNMGPLEFVYDRLSDQESPEVREQLRKIEDWLWEHGEPLRVEDKNEREDVRTRLRDLTDQVIREMERRADGAPWGEFREAVVAFANDPLAYRNLPLGEAADLLKQEVPSLAAPAFPQDRIEAFLREIGLMEGRMLARVRRAAAQDSQAAESEAMSLASGKGE
jgi:hypothetical protein